MPINNSYSQTPKRIFTNKPFIKGMAYTNADLDPYVCRAVANLELESSNSATKTRLGIKNNAIGNAGETAYAFYNKYVLFSNYVLEDDYNKNITVATSNGLGIRVLDKDLNEHEIYNYIISNNTELSISNGELSRTGDTGISKTGCSIYALKMNENDIPHCINNEDYSFLFFGIIKQNNYVIYRGMIKLFYHVAANKIIIETITPDIVDNYTVSDYGVNIISNNPSIYKDYVTYSEHDFYRDYMGDTIGSTDSKDVIDILTVAMYDDVVNSLPYTINTNANMIKGINSTLNSDVYIRPYVALPSGISYGAIVKANNNYGAEMYYDFGTDKFVYANSNTVSVSTTKNISIPTYAKRNEPSFSNNTELFSDAANSTYLVNSIKIPAMNLIAIDKETSRMTSDDSDYIDYFEINKTDVAIYKLSTVAATYSNPTMPFEHTATFTSSKIECSYVDCIDLENQFTYNPQVNHTISWNERDSYYVPVHLEMIAYSGDTSNNKVVLICPFNFKAYDPLGYTSNGYSTFNVDEEYNNELITLDRSLYMTICIDYAHQEYRTFELIIDRERLEVDHNGFGVAQHITPNHIVIQGDTYKFTLKPVSVVDSNDLPVSTQGSIEDYFKECLATVDGLRVVNSSYDTQLVYMYGTNSREGYQIDTSVFSFTSDLSISAGVRLRMNAAISQYYETAPYTETSSNDLSLVVRCVANAQSQDSNVVGTLNTSVIYNFSSTFTECAGTIYDSIHDATYTYNNVTTEMSVADMISMVDYGTANTDTVDTLEVTATNSRTGVYENYINVFTNELNNKNFNIKVKQSAFSDINGSSIKVSVFPITGSTSTDTPPRTYFFKETSVVTKNLYTIRTDKYDAVDHNEIAYNHNIKSTATRVCNHLGHVVVWGDNTNSNSLYYSEYGNPGYFPSNYVITLNNPIVYAYPHNGNLIVFTTDDIYMLHSGNVPSTTSTDGSEIAFTQTLVQSNTRIGKENIHTVRSIGKDVFFINNNNNGYLLKANKYVSNVSDVYLIRVTNQINDLLNDPFNYAKERYSKWIANASFSNTQQLNIEYVKHEYDDDVNIDDPSDVYVIDGDTIEYNNVRYRLASIDTPEVVHDNDPTSSNEYLGPSAKILLQRMISSSSQVKIFDTEDTDLYDRHLVYLSVVIDDETVSVNDTMLYNGLAKFYDENHNTGYHAYCRACYSLAKQLHNGLHNKYTYQELTSDYAGATEFIDITSDTQHSSWNNTEFRLYTYTTNSFIYIFQPIKLNVGKTITIIYKYNIDSKVWITYDVLGFILPSDIINDYNILGFKILTNNDDGLFGIPSIIEFKDKCDVSNIVYTITNNNDYSLSTNTAVSRDINVYFDSGNQSISLMNDKLFREIKLSLGSLPDSLLNMDYSIDFYVDGKLVIPNQKGNCNTHVHHNPINTHYAGSEENLAGFKKITFFAPSRGRIPRIVFSINCTNDINILEYAIVYMQLNAK